MTAPTQHPSLRSRFRWRVAVFTDKYPFLGPLVWVLSAQTFLTQFIVAAAWPTYYSLRTNVISDLGNTACGQFGDRFVCSPQHGLMNASFVLLGSTMAIGALLVYQEFRRSRATLVGFGCMAVAGLGTGLVGVFPENVNPPLHGLSAFMAFGPGNVSLIILGLAIKDARPSFRAYTLLSGVISLVALALFVTGHHLGLGHGGMERIVSYPQTIWLILFGVYMSATRWKAGCRPWQNHRRHAHLATPEE